MLQCIPGVGARPTFKQLFVLLLPLLLSNEATWAADDGLFGATAIPEVLTPARLRQPQSEVPASVTTIDRELIEASGAREIFDVLKLVPGMNAAVTDGASPNVNYHASQSLDSRRMLVLIDGRSVYQPGLARVKWNDFPITLDDIERIEITRGPASAAYGSNAFLGVINIITRDPADQSGTHAALRAGNHAVKDWSLSHAQGNADNAWRFSAASRGDRGYDKQAPGETPPHNSKRVNTVNLSGRWQLDDNDRLDLRTGGSRTQLDIPENSSIAQFAAATEQPKEEHSRWFAQVGWQHAFSETHQWQGQAYFQRFNETSRNPVCMKSIIPGIPESGALLFTKELNDLYRLAGGDTEVALGLAMQALNSSNPSSLSPAQQAFLLRAQTLAGSGAGTLCGDLRYGVREQRTALELQDTLNIGRLRLVTGVSLHDNRGVSATYLSGGTSNQVGSIFTAFEWRLLDSWLINAGGNYEHDRLNGDSFAPRVANIFKLSPGQSIRFVYAEANRSMDMYENEADAHLQLKGINSPWAANLQALLGQPTATIFATPTSPGNLDAERIRSREIGYYAHAGRLDLDVRWFHEQLTNLVSGPTNIFDFRANNDGRMRNYGWETQVAWRATNRQLWRATFGHINSHANYRPEQRFVAENSGSLLWRYDFAEHWMLAAAWYASHDWNDYRYDRYSTTLTHTIPLPNASLKLGATLRWKNDQPEVFEENIYRNNREMWLTAALDF